MSKKHCFCHLYKKAGDTQRQYLYTSFVIKLGTLPSRPAISIFEPVWHLEPSIPKLCQLSFLLDMTLNWYAQEFSLSRARSGAHMPLTRFLSYMVLCKIPKPNPYRPFAQRVWVCCLHFLCPPYLLHKIKLSPPLEEKQESTTLQGETFANLGSPALHNRNTADATAARQRGILRWMIREMFHVKIKQEKWVKVLTTETDHLSSISGAWWKEKTRAWKLFSDLRKQTMVAPECPHTHTIINMKRKNKEKKWGKWGENRRKDVLNIQNMYYYFTNQQYFFQLQVFGSSLHWLHIWTCTGHISCALWLHATGPTK